MNHAEQPRPRRRGILLWIKHRLRWSRDEGEFVTEVTDAGVVCGLGPDPDDLSPGKDSEMPALSTVPQEACLDVAYLDTSEDDLVEGDAPGDGARVESRMEELEPTPRGGLQFPLTGPDTRIIYDSVRRCWLAGDGQTSDD